MSSVQETLLFRVNIEIAGSTPAQLNAINKSIQNITSTLKGTGSSMNTNLEKTLQGIGSQERVLIQNTDRLNSSLGKIGTGPAATNLKRIQTNMTQLNSALISGGRGADSYAASMQKITTPLNVISGSVNRAADSLGLYKNSMQTATATGNAFAAQQERIATFNMNVQKSFATAGESALLYGRQVDSAAAVTQQLGAANNRAVGSMRQLTAATEEANIAQKTGVGYDSERATSMMNNVRHISGVALSFMSLSQAMDSVQGIGEMVAMQQEKVAMAHQRVVEALAKYGPASNQYRQAVDAEAKATRGLNYEQREANFALHNLMFMVGLVAIELTNSLLPIMVKVIAKIKEMGGMSAVATAAMSKIGAAASAMGVAMGIGGTKTAKAMTEVEQSAAKSGKGVVGAMDMMKIAAADVLGNIIPLSWSRGKKASAEFVQDAATQAGKYKGTIEGMGNSNKAIMAGIAADVATNIGQVLPREFSKGANAVSSLPERSRGPLNTFEDITTRTAMTSKDAMGNIGRYALEAGSVVAGAAPIMGRFGKAAEQVGIQSLMGAGNVEKLGLTTRIMGALVKTGWGALIAAAAAVVLYGTNTFGARDAVNAFGVSIGKTNPVLKTLGDLGVTVAGAIGLTGESADKTRGHFDQLTKDFDTLATGWHNTIALMQQSDNQLVRDVANTIVNVTDAFGKLGTDFGGQVQASINTWKLFTDTLEKHDYKKAVDIIGQAFAALPGIFQQIGTDIGGIFAELDKGIVKFATDVGTQLNTWAQGVIQTMSKWVTDLGGAIKGGFESVVGITTEVMGRINAALSINPAVQAITKGAEAIKTAITNIAQPILTALKPVTDQMQKIADFMSGKGKGLNPADQQLGIDPKQQWHAQTEFGGMESQPPVTGQPLPPTAQAPKQDWQHGGASGKKFDPATGKWVSGEGSMSPFYNSPFNPQSRGDIPGSMMMGGVQNVGFREGLILPQSRPTEHVGTHLSSNTMSADVARGRAALGQNLTVPEPQMASDDETQGARQLITKPQEKKNIQDTAKPQMITPQMTDEPNIVEETNVAYKELNETIGKMQTSYNDYQDILKTTEGVAALEKMGTLDRQTAYQKMQASLISNTASNKEYSKQVKEGGILHTSFNQGVQDTVTQLLDEQVELANTTGRHTEMGAQLNKGIPQMISYNQGVQEQVGALQDQQRETANTTGKNMELMNQMKDGTARQAAYAKGFVDSSYAINQQQVAVTETTGSLDAYAVAIGTGQLATTSFGEGVNEARKQLIDSYAAMNQSEGALMKYNIQLSTGVPQAIAYKQALLDQQMASAKLKTEYAGLFGAYQGLVKAMTDGNTVFDMQTKAFAEGLNEAGKWGESMLTAAEKERGLMQGTEEMGAILGVKLPGWFNGSAESAQEFISVMANVGSGAEKMTQSMNQAGQSISQGLAQAMLDGGNKIKEELDKLEKAVGTDFPDSMEKALAGSGMGQVMAGQIKAFGEQGTQAFANMPMDDVMQFSQNFIGTLEDEFERMPPQMQAKVQPIMDAIYTELNKSPEEINAEGGIQAWLNHITELAQQISPATSTASQALANMSKTDLSPIGKGYEQTLQSISNTTPLSKAQQEFLNTSLKAQGLGQAVFDAQGKITGFTSATGQAGTAAGTTAGGLDKATASADATTQGFVRTAQQGAILDQTLAQMATITLQGIAQGFAALPAAIAPAFTTILQQAGLMNTTLIQITATTLPAIAAAFAALPALIQPTFTVIIEAATVFFQTLIGLVAPNMVQFVAAAEPTIPGFQLIFDTITQNITTTFQTWIQMTQQNVQQITTEVQALVGVYNDTYKRAVEDAAGYLHQLEQANSKIIQNITSEVQKIVGVFNDSFKRAANDAAGYLNQLAGVATKVMQQIAQAAQQAASMIDRIGQSASNAASQVRSLANEINSLQDKTVTITVITRRVTVGAASGMSPTVFMAAGGSNIQSKMYSGAGGNQNSRVIVGESGDETIMRTGMKSNRTTVENVDHIKYVKGLGAREPEILTVVPLEGTNAMNFRNKHPEYYASGVYNAGSYPSYQQTLPAPQALPTSFSKMLYGRIKRDKHGNITIGGRLVFRGGPAMDFDAYEGRHISHGSHGNPKDRRHFQQFDGSNEDIKHNGIPFTFGDLTDNKFQLGMQTGIGKSRGLPVGGAFGSTLDPAHDDGYITPDIDEIPLATSDRLQASQRLYNDYISERVAAARDTPRTQQQDAVNGFIDNQGDPLAMEYNEGAVSGAQMDSVPPRLLPHHRQGMSTVQRSYEEDYTLFMKQLIEQITKKIDGKLRINLHSQVDTRIWGKITNQQVLNDMVRS